jgi:hypothetical protein
LLLLLVAITGSWSSSCSHCACCGGARLCILRSSSASTLAGPPCRFSTLAWAARCAAAAAVARRGCEGWGKQDV